MAENYTVYKHISPNGKQYVGITKQDVIKRWANGEGYKNCTYFYNAIQKYGWENFQHIILYTGLSREEACEIEKNLIEELDLLNPEKGYNLKTGGRYGVLTEEGKNKISKSLIGNNFRTGIPHTQGTIEHFKEIRAGKIRTNGLMNQEKKYVNIDLVRKLLKKQNGSLVKLEKVMVIHFTASTIRKKQKTF